MGPRGPTGFNKQTNKQIFFLTLQVASYETVSMTEVASSSSPLPPITEQVTSTTTALPPREMTTSSSQQRYTTMDTYRPQTTTQSTPVTQTYEIQVGTISGSFHYVQIKLQYCKSGNFCGTFIFVLFALNLASAKIKTREYILYMSPSMEQKSKIVNKE